MTGARGLPAASGFDSPGREAAPLWMHRETAYWPVPGQIFRTAGEKAVLRNGEKKNKKVIRYRRPLNINVGMIIFAIIFIYLMFSATTI